MITTELDQMPKGELLALHAPTGAVWTDNNMAGVRCAHCRVPYPCPALKNRVAKR